MRFPGFKDKAVTLSYDDGVAQDKRLISIMSKYGLKGTFNINSGMFGRESTGTSGRMTAEEAVRLYTESGNEVAVHGYKHISLADVDSAVALNDIIEDRKNLETLFGRVIKGMAYANGSYNDRVVEQLRMCGIHYSRTTVSTGDFKLPSDWLRLPATCHHNDPRLMELAKKFTEFDVGKYFWRNYPRMFYLWGHSYEFDNDDNWNVIEEFAEYIGGRDDIWYATNGEIYDYIQSYERLEFSADGKLVYNPTVTDIYITSYGKNQNYMVAPGQTVRLD